MAFNLEDIKDEEPKKPSLIHLGKPTEEEIQKYLTRPMPPPPIPKRGVGSVSIHREKLNLYEDEILELIINGVNFRDLAIRYDVPTTCLFEWARMSERSAKFSTALEISSETYVQMAEDVLLDDQNDGNMAEIQRRKELSQFYRWKASKRAPKVFGDKQVIEHSGEVNQGLTDDKFALLLKTLVEKKDTKEIGDRNSGIEEVEEVK